MNINNYLDSTYLKTAEQAGLSEAENVKMVTSCIQEAIDMQFKLVMIRPEHVPLAKQMIAAANAKLTVGTVIGFPEGTATLEEKLHEAQQAIHDGADDLDFVCNYKAFVAGAFDEVKNEIYQCTKLGLEQHKIVKWIIEIAALTDKQIIQICSLIKKVVLSHFHEKLYPLVYVKSSTGFFVTPDNSPNGATIPAIIMMLENASPLSVKAAGGVKSYKEALQMINLGVNRIGTSAARAIAEGQVSDSNY